MTQLSMQKGHFFFCREAHFVRELINTSLIFFSQEQKSQKQSFDSHRLLKLESFVKIEKLLVNATKKKIKVFKS